MKLFNSLCFASLASAEVFFKEDFSVEGWESRWVQSKHKDDYGNFVLESGKWNDMLGLKTSTDAKFYASSASFDKFTNKDKNLVVQLTVQHQQKIDCGGGYVKIFPSTVTAEEMHGESEYNIMFGPDICGYSTKKVHVIFNYNGKNHLISKDIKCKEDERTHIYTLIVKPDNTYKVLIDNTEQATGAIEEDWDILPPKKIKDPAAVKPSQEEWDEREEISDPDSVKPDDWEKPEHVPKPDAEQPEDWDEDMDGEWEAPMVDNPEYKGDWKAPMIKNPEYKGKWVHPEIDNPEYSAEPSLYGYDDFGRIGLDLWQVKSGTIFSNFLITDDIELADKEAKELMVKLEEEKKIKDAEKEAENKKSEEDKAEADDDDDEIDVDDDGDDDSDDYPVDDDDYPADDDLEDLLDHDEL